MQLHPDGYYTSELLTEHSVYHGFGTRRFQIEKLKGLAEVPCTKQIHSNQSEFLESVDQNKFYIGDAWLTSNPHICCYVRTADCLPLLIYDPIKNIVAAVHAGWRGLAAHIISNAVDKFTAMGSKTEDLIAVIGPRIRQDCYEVGEEVIKAFSDTPADVIPTETKIHFHGDNMKPTKFSLAAAARQELKNKGLGKIDEIKLCTYCSDDFFSYRRYLSEEGRQINFIMPFRR